MMEIIILIFGVLMGLVSGYSIGFITGAEKYSKGDKK
jgi:hypothetical protein